MNDHKINLVKQRFQDSFNREPLLVFSPGRINLIGEHTDYNDGFAFPAAVDKGIYMAIGSSDKDTSTAFALDLEESFDFSFKEIYRIPNGGWRNYIVGVVAEIQKLGIQFTSFNCVFSGDIPNGAGMSSSAALENSLVFGLNELFWLGLSRTQMIYISQAAEHNFAGVKCGIMDQYASMFGVENSALQLDCRSVTSVPFKIDFKDYRLMLINTNVKHELSETAYNERRAVCEKVANLLKVKALRDITIEDLCDNYQLISEEDFSKVSFVVEENHRVKLFSKAIQKNQLTRLGELLYDSHDGLSSKYKVSCEELDFLVEMTKDNPFILGSRMMGGGFGGCTINLIQKDEIKPFTKAISKQFKDKFNKECSIYNVNLSDGTHLIVK